MSMCEDAISNSEVNSYGPAYLHVCNYCVKLLKLFSNCVVKKGMLYVYVLTRSVSRPWNTSAVDESHDFAICVALDVGVDHAL